MTVLSVAMKRHYWNTWEKYRYKDGKYIEEKCRSYHANKKLKHS